MITAKEFLINNAKDISFKGDQMFASNVTPQMLIEFAKLHTKKAFYYGKIYSSPDQCIMEEKLSLEDFLLTIK